MQAKRHNTKSSHETLGNQTVHMPLCRLKDIIQRAAMVIQVVRKKVSGTTIHRPQWVSRCVEECLPFLDFNEITYSLANLGHLCGSTTTAIGIACCMYNVCRPLDRMLCLCFLCNEL